MSNVFNMLYDVQSQKILMTKTFPEIIDLELHGIHTFQKKYERSNVSELQVPLIIYFYYKGIFAEVSKILLTILHIFLKVIYSIILQFIQLLFQEFFY